MSEVVAYILHILQVKEHLSFVSSFVDPKRKEKAERYAFENDKLLSLGAGYLLKKYLPRGEIKESENGKPFLSGGPFFNISHSGEYVVLAIHPTREVGIDIEQINEHRIDAIQYVLSEEEKKIDDPKMLFQIWSNKESLIKCISSGLKDIKRINGLPLEGVRLVDGKDYYSKAMIFDSYSLSLTLRGNEPFNIKLQIEETIE